MLRRFGLDPACIEPDTPLSEVSTLAEFIKKAHLALRDTPVLAGTEIYELDRKTIPSWTIAEELRRRRSRDKGAAASDLTDSYLAALLPYADITEVDKRTFEYLARLAGPNSSLAVHCSSAVRCPYYPTKRLHVRQDSQEQRR